MGDEELVEAPNDSLIRKAKKKMEESKLLEQIVKWVVIAVLSAGAASGKVGNVENEAVGSNNHADILALKDEINILREGLKQRINVEEKERIQAMHELEIRLLTRRPR